MTYWIYPWKEKYYDLFGCLQKFGYVEWRQRNRVSKGDRVLLYAGGPVFRLVLLFTIEETDIPFSKINTWSFSSINSSKPLKPTEFYSRLEPIAFFDEYNPVFSREYLLRLGMPERIQQPVKANSEIINLIIKNIEVLNPQFNATHTEFEEGAAKYRINHLYERNQFARRECLRLKGYRCEICGLNFEEKYGEIGKNFIEVHHVNFISNFCGKSHKVDPTTGLIPVCSNCHSMLHHKHNGVYLSPEQLKQMIHQASTIRQNES